MVGKNVRINEVTRNIGKTLYLYLALIVNL